MLASHELVDEVVNERGRGAAAPSVASRGFLWCFHGKILNCL